MAITQTNTTRGADAESVTIALADVGCNVPDGVSVIVHQLTDDVLEVTRTEPTSGRSHTFTVERCLGGVAEVTLKDLECPTRVPDWLAAVVCDYYDDVGEVVLGR